LKLLCEEWIGNLLRLNQCGFLEDSHASVAVVLRMYSS